MSDTLAKVMEWIHINQYERFHRGVQPIEIPFYGRNDLPVLFHSLGFTMGAEIGVESGRYSKVLLENNPGSKLLCVDAWKAYRAYRDHVRQEKIDQMLIDTNERLKGLNYEILRGFSVDMAKKVPDESLDYVFIDANHKFQFVVADLAAWVPKVKKGGIVSGHDWFRDSRNGPYHIIPAVTGWVDAYCIAPLFLLTSDQGKSKSWFYVKEF